MKRVTISLDEETIEQFKQDADANGLKLSTYLRMRLSQMKEAENDKDKTDSDSSSK